jgi:hypothetical protein
MISERYRQLTPSWDWSPNPEGHARVPVRSERDAVAKLHCPYPHVETAEHHPFKPIDFAREALSKRSFAGLPLT